MQASDSRSESSVKLPAKRMAPRTLIFLVLGLALVGAGLGSEYLRGMEEAKSAVAEIHKLLPEIDRASQDTIDAIRKRAETQLGWLEQGELANHSAESQQLHQWANQLCALSFKSETDFERADRLQTQISDVLAQKLAAGKISKDLAKKIEAIDMDVQRKRTHFFDLLQREALLTHTPFLQKASSVAYMAIPTFPSEKLMILQTRPPKGSALRLWLASIIK